MPYPNDNRGAGLPVSQHHSMRLPNDRAGMVGMSRPSPPHGHQANMNIPSYNNFGRHEYRHPPPHPRHTRTHTHGHVGNLPPHFNEMSGASFPGYSPSHAVAHRQGDEYTISGISRRRQPPLSPGPDSASGPEGPQHPSVNIKIHAPPPNVRRGPFSPYNQAYFEYNDYNRALPASGSHSPTMRPSNSMREAAGEGGVLRRFPPMNRSMSAQDRQHMMASESRQMGPPREQQQQHMGPPDTPSRLQENWREKDYYERSPINRHAHVPHDENILPPPSMRQSPQYRSSNCEILFRGPQNVRLTRPPPPFDPSNQSTNPRHMQLFDRSPPIIKNDNHTDDDQSSSGVRSNDENSAPEKEDIANNVGCTCKKSKCLKLYCQCFASSAMCVATCRCIACKNIPKHEIERGEAIRSIMMRNPNAFDTKFKATAEGKSSKVSHKLGCKCRKSACLKKYCECYHAEVKCSTNCRCTGCQNTADSGPPAPFVRQVQAQANYVPMGMIDAARDLAGLKNSSPSKLPPSSQPKTPARPTAGSVDLYPVPSLTNSGTPSKEDDTYSEDQQQQQQQHPLNIDRSSHKGLSKDKESSPVDALLSAAYALTELQGFPTHNSPVTKTPDAKTVGGAIISPSPKRKMSDTHNYIFQNTPMNVFQNTSLNEDYDLNHDRMMNSTPSKRNRRGEEFFTTSLSHELSPEAIALTQRGAKEFFLRDRLGDDIESESR